MSTCSRTRRLPVSQSFSRGEGTSTTGYVMQRNYSSCFPSLPAYLCPLCLPMRISPCVGQLRKFGQILLGQGKGSFSIRAHAISYIVNLIYSRNVPLFSTRNPTPNDSEYPKWLPTTAFPLDYYRMGTKDFEGQVPLAMEKGLFEERSAFWNKYMPHLAVNHEPKGEL